MKTLIFISSLFVLVCAVQNSFSQLVTVENNKKWVAEVKNRKLRILALEENEKVVKKLEKTSPEQVDDYKKFVSDYNKLILDAANTFWPYTKEVSFSTYEEMAEAKNYDNKKNYADLYFNYTIGFQVPSIKTYSLEWPIDTGKFVIRHQVSDRGTTLRVSIQLAEISHTLYSLYFPHHIPTKGDMAFVFQYLVWYIDHPTNEERPYKIAQENSLKKAKNVRDYTLLINRSDIDQAKLADTSIFKSKYKYPYQIVSPETFDSIVWNKVSGYAYLILAPYNLEGYLHYYPMILSTDGEPLVFIMPTSGNRLGSELTMTQGYSRVNSKLMEAIAKEIDESLQKK